MVFSSLKF